MNVFVLSLTDLACRRIKCFITWPCLPTALKAVNHHSSLYCIKTVLERALCHISMQSHVRKVNVCQNQSCRRISSSWMIALTDGCENQCDYSFMPSHPSSPKACVYSNALLPCDFSNSLGQSVSILRLGSCDGTELHHAWSKWSLLTRFPPELSQVFQIRIRRVYSVDDCNAFLHIYLLLKLTLAVKWPQEKWGYELYFQQTEADVCVTWWYEHCPFTTLCPSSPRGVE